MYYERSVALVLSGDEGHLCVVALGCVGEAECEQHTHSKRVHVIQTVLWGTREEKERER